jgi:hypothetical protein
MIAPEKKIRPLIFIIALLLLTNIAMVLFFIFSKTPCDTSAQGKGQNLVATFLEKEIGFDERQMALYQKIKKDDFEKARPLFRALKNSKDSFYLFIYNSDAPDSLVKNSATVIGKNQVIVDIKMLEHFRRVRKICTEQQLVKFDSSFKNVISKITSGKKKRSENK